MVPPQAGCHAGDVVLAYVFWHRPAMEVDPAAYEARLRSFHDRLASSLVPGLLGTRTVRVPPLRWLPDGGYEDWYLVDGFAALGELNAGAVDAAHRPDHDAVAADVDHGVGGLYALLEGDPLADAACHTWFAKPAGVAYDDFHRRLHRPPLRGGAATALWQRQLVLGPAPEYCLVAPADQR